MNLSELIAAARRGTIPDRAIAITLDDGALDALTAAAPALAAVRMPATFFVSTSGLDHPSEPWWDTFERIFVDGAMLPAELALRVGDERVVLPTRDADDVEAARTMLYPLLVRLSPVARDAAIDALVRWSAIDARVRESHRTLSGEELRQLARLPGVTIGAHSVTHASLPSQDVDTRRREIVESRTTLERWVGQPIELFCYPYGHFDDATVREVRASHFAAATTCERGVVDAGLDPLRTPRLIVPPITRSQLEGLMEELLRTTAGGVGASVGG